jgi:ATP-dependent DNA ligase
VFSLANACEHLPPDPILDGEIVALDKRWADLVQPASASPIASTCNPILYFDVIVHRGKRRFKAPLENWREILLHYQTDHCPFSNLSEKPTHPVSSNQRGAEELHPA